MKIINNITEKLSDELKQDLRAGSRLSIAAACFSVYAFEELKTQLLQIDALRFIFTSPTFLAEQPKQEQREFYIPRRNREKALHSSEFEIRLRNAFTQRAISKECADWIRQKAVFKSNSTDEQMPGFLTVDGDAPSAYAPISGFTRAELGCERGGNMFSMINKIEAPESKAYLTLFDQLWADRRKMKDVTEQVLERITTAYRENSPEFLYFFALYHIFSDFLTNVSADDLPNDTNGFRESKVWNKLYTFQKDAVLAIISKLEQYNGCILADSVGLGKTFTALAVIKYYENRNKSVLVLCPKKLAANWNIYKGNYVNNPLVEDRFRYDVLYHTDLSRSGGTSNGIDLAALNWGNFDLVVIDESHNFRNGSNTSTDEKENRYTKLMNCVIRSGVRTKVLMLSATPVNNRFVDLKNQLALAYEGDAGKINEKLNTSSPIDEIFRQAQKAFNTWSKLPVTERTTNALLAALDFDFFEVLDSVTIARSRRHIEKYYNISDVGTFPERLKPISVQPCLTSLDNAINYQQIYNVLDSLTLHIYTPTSFILSSRISKYIDPSQHGKGLTQAGREEGIRRLMSINLLKRLESSVYAFRLTIDRISKLIEDTMQSVRSYQNGSRVLELNDISDATDWDDDDQNNDIFTVGRKVKIDLADMDHVSWLHDLEKDAENLELLSLMVQDITPAYDAKLQELLRLIDEKQRHPINPGNRKIIIFTAFSDTADYLYQNISGYVKQAFGLNTAEITGSVDGKTTIPKLSGDLNTVLTCFSPISKRRDSLPNANHADIDLLIATDCISEGQNLQDCDYLINYDIHWNPVRIIQRFGRIDRIGSQNRCIQLVNFWPDVDLDEYINLKGRVETRMKLTVMTSTGDDNLISPEEKGDLEYRSAQLKRLKNEVVDLEEMSGGISIMDLGLNEFRLDLLDYMKKHDDVEHTPLGMHAIVASAPDAPPGVIFVLKNINNEINVDQQNRLHPFYMVYIGQDGSTVCDYLSPKELLDRLRLLCKGKTEPDQSLCQQFNQATDDGKNMSAYSELLSEAIRSILDAKEESDIDSLFKMGGTTALLSSISGLDDFELICFLVVQ